MTPRKKKCLGTMISGGDFIVIGIIIVTTTATADWVPTVLTIIGLVGNALGFTLVFPDHD